MYHRLAPLWRTSKFAATNGYVINSEQERIGQGMKLYLPITGGQQG